MSYRNEELINKRHINIQVNFRLQMKKDVDVWGSRQINRLILAKMNQLFSRISVKVYISIKFGI